MTSPADIDRILGQLEKVTERLSGVATDLALVADRQATTSATISELQRGLASESMLRIELERKVDKWIHRGWGAWGMAVVLFTVLTALWAAPWKSDTPVMTPPSREVPASERRTPIV